MEIRWSPLADADTDSIFEFIAEDNPVAAVSVDRSIQAAVERLVEFPRLGRAGRVSGTRELVVSGTPYIVVYKAHRNVLRILRVLHGAMMWPEEPPRK